ncbi:hypothetical protein BDD12DRAFT_694128, partial [Trichophaea hybrida]
AERKLHRKHPVVLNILGSMARSLYEQGRLEESLAWYIWLQRVRKNVLGRSHYSTMGALIGIADIYLKKGRLEEAEEMFLTVYHEREKAFRENHLVEYDVHTMDTIAMGFQKAENYDEALRWLNRALAGREEALGENHTDTLNTVYSIGLVYMIKKDYDEA